MKLLKYIPFVLLCSFCFLEATAQDAPPARRARQRPGEAQTNNLPDLTERARIKNEQSSQGLSHVVWSRELYRYVDLTKENNAALYYPTRPMGERQNLFTLLFKLVLDEKIPAYKYLDGREVFTDENKINIGELMATYDIYHTSEGTGENIRYKVEDSDIPGEDVTLYMVKEGWYFDEATGSFQSQVIALAPHLVREDFNYGSIMRDPLFWVTYDDIRPYLSREYIMTSNLNNTLTYTMDDFFRKSMYEGDIVKTTNLMNRSLAQEVGDDDAKMQAARDSIEGQLKLFEKSLWVYSDTIVAADTTGHVKATKKEKATTTKRGSSTSTTKAPKSSSSSGPTKSVRRTR